MSLNALKPFSVTRKIFVLLMTQQAGNGTCWKEKGIVA